MSNRKNLIAALFLVLLSWCLAGNVHAQELEARALSNVPVGTNFLVVGFGHSWGNILLDPSLPIEGLDSRLNTVFLGYLRSLDLFGKSAKLDVIVPFAGGDWAGLFEGQQSAALRTGFGDPRFRLSVNLTGAPALTAQEFKSREQKTVIGVSLQVIAPLGQYDSSKLLNLSSNRWTFRSQIGISHPVGKWTIEGYGGVWLSTSNPRFLGESKLTQKPLVTGKFHVIRSLPRGVWLAFDGGYGIGGRTSVDGVPRNTRISGLRFGVTLAVPLGANHSIKLVTGSGKRIEKGPDFNFIGITYQYRWF